MSPRFSFRAAAVLVLPVLVAGVWSVGPAWAQASDAGPEEPTGEVLARVGEEAVTRAEVETAADEALEQARLELLQCQARLEKARHDALEATTRNMVRDRLLEREATARGVTKDELLRQEVAAHVEEVSQEDVDTFYDENRARIGERPLEQISTQIEAFIRQEREAGAYARFISSLEDKYDVAYAIEPYRVEIDVEGEPSTGPADAPVTIVEFSDFECPFCFRMLPTLERVEETYGDRVRIVFKQYPLRNIHENAQLAAEASLCARDQGRFWGMHDAMFADQAALGRDDLVAKAEEVGMDPDAFATCLDSGRYTEAVEEDLREGTIAGVSGTPALFVNGRLLPGAVPYERISEVIEDELSREGS